MTTLAEKKVSSRELRRAYQAHAEDLKAFTSAASTDLVKLQEAVQATREFCTDLSTRLDKIEADLAQTKGAIVLFITQPVAERAQWLAGEQG